MRTQEHARRLHNAQLKFPCCWCTADDETGDKDNFSFTRRTICYALDYFTESKHGMSRFRWDWLKCTSACICFHVSSHQIRKSNHTKNLNFLKSLKSFLISSKAGHTVYILYVVLHTICGTIIQLVSHVNKMYVHMYSSTSSMRARALEIERETVDWFFGPVPRFYDLSCNALRNAKCKYTYYIHTSAHQILQ